MANGFNDYDPIFKGCTRPSMIWGVPLIPLVAASVPMLISGVWGLRIYPPAGLFSLFCLIPTFFVLRWITKKDDQRLMQLLLRFQMRIKQKNRVFWHSHCYSPIRYKKTWHD